MTAGMVYYGLDCSLRKPGLAVVNELGRPLYVDSLSVADAIRGSRRLHTIYAWILSILKGFPEAAGAAYEGPSFNSTHQEFSLGEACGAARVALYTVSPLEPLAVAPTQLKQFATGHSGAEKSEVIHAVKNIFGVDTFGDDDAADAYVLARIAWSCHHKSQLTRRCELEVHKALFQKPVAPPKRRRSPSIPNL